MILEGDQVLVFCLGGIPAWSAASSPPNPDNSPPNCLGFSTNPRIPALPTDDRIGPFFEFTSSRLVVIPQQTAFTAQLARSPQHYSYLDTFGVSDGKGGYISGAPYAYFSSYKGPNGYNRYYDPNTASATYFPFSDCPRLNVWPYAESRAPVKYLKSSSFQIISAGLNGFFGGGTALADSSGNPTPTPPLWTPANAAFFYPAGSDGYDDQANFTSSLLGVGAD